MRLHLDTDFLIYAKRRLDRTLRPRCICLAQRTFEASDASHRAAVSTGGARTSHFPTREPIQNHRGTEVSSESLIFHLEAAQFFGDGELQD
jgi:hypothetical protein